MQQDFLIVAALSSRPYVAAAVQAGFAVVVIDAFADIDTTRLAKNTFQVELVDGQFARQSLLDTLNALDLKHCIGFCYGAGFEANSALLDEIAKQLPLIGNAADVVERCKDPAVFCATCDALSMAYPQTALRKPTQTEGWLIKQVGASGGAHVRSLTATAALAGNTYYQKFQAGMPVSCLFVANGKHASVLGYSEQWCSPLEDSPYAYGGAMSHAELDEQIKRVIAGFVQGVTQKLGLRGINSCDFIIDAGRVFALEINPRLSATMDLYRGQEYALFKAHIDAVIHGILPDSAVDKTPRAHQIIYATQTITIARDMDWPSWVGDIPQANSNIQTGVPICTVYAEANTVTQAKQLVKARAAACMASLARNDEG